PGLMAMVIPNLRHFETVGMLTEGRWIESPNGVMDPAHLRFFTGGEFTRCVRDAGLELRGLRPFSQTPSSAAPRDASGCVTVGRVRFGPLLDAEYRQVLTMQYLALIARP